MASGVSALNDDAAVRPNPGPGHATGEQSRPAFNASTDGRTDKSVNGRVRASRGPGAYPRGRWRRNSKQIRRPRPRGYAPGSGLRGLELRDKEGADFTDGYDRVRLRTENLIQKNALERRLKERPCLSCLKI